jgi:hypothetical protein
VIQSCFALLRYIHTKLDYEGLLAFDYVRILQPRFIKRATLLVDNLWGIPSLSVIITPSKVGVSYNADLLGINLHIFSN